MYEGAEGVDSDPVKSKELLERAAEMGDVNALNFLGYLLYKGADGVEVDSIRAKELFEKAIGYGSIPALGESRNHACSRM